MIVRQAPSHRPRWLLVSVAAWAFAIGCSGAGRTGNTGADAGMSATKDGGSPASTCGDRPGLPAGVTAEASGHGFSVRCGGLPLDLQVVEPGIVRLHYGAAAARASYAVVADPKADTPVSAGTTADGFVVCTPALRTFVQTSDCHVRVEQMDGTVILDDPASGGYFTGSASPTPGAPAQTVHGLVRSVTPDEHFYGLGLRTGAHLDRRGRTLELWNTDAYDSTAGGFRPDADPVYESIPFFIGLRGGVAYGSLIDDTSRLRFDLADSDPSTYRVTAFGGPVTQFIIAGPSIAEVLRRYTWLTGRLPLPPRWALGFQLSRWDGPCDTPTPDQLFCTADGVRSVAARLRADGIPADGLWLDIQHMDGFRSWTWDPTRFPDPAGLTADLAAQGFKTVAIVDPALKVDPGWAPYDTALGSGYFLSDATGQPFVGAVWPGDASFPDFSDPAVRAWWASLAQAETARGVRGLWIDMNEPSNFVDGTVPDTLRADGDGSPGTMAALHNVYGLNEARATYQGMRAASPERPFVLSRAAFAGQQRYSAVWTGDAPSTWQTLQMTLPQLLGLGLSGMAFAGSDVGGYSGRAESTGELYARWMALGAVSPFFRAHAAEDARRQEPWAFGSDVEAAVRHTIRQRYALLPYLYSLFREASQTGAPILRPLVYEFQDDPATYDLADEAMLGPSILVAPIVKPAADINLRQVYLPPGRWFGLRSGAVYDGGTTLTVTSTPDPLPLTALPAYVRQGAIVPRADAMAYSGQHAIDPLYLDVYPGPDAASFTLYEDDGDSFDFEAGTYSAVTYTTQATVTGATLTAGGRDGSYVPPARRLVIRVRRVDHDVQAVTLSGVALSRAGSYQALLSGDAAYFYDADDRALVVGLPDAPRFELDMTYDPSLDPAAATVEVPVLVHLPAGTPPGATIAIASSANGWTQQPLTRSAAGDTATGSLRVPRGQWFFYKFTRGSWATVEKSGTCAEIPNRAALGAAHPGIADTVAAWADACP